MDLFNQTEELKNILPKDGEVINYGFAFSKLESDRYYKIFLDTIAWKHDEAIMYGKRIITNRKIAWYVDDNVSYVNNKINREGLSFTNELLEIKKQIEALTKESYNSCLLNLYHNGSEGISWHSDGEDYFKKNGSIASITFGAERKFAFKHKETKETVALVLQHGSALVMKGETQKYWVHSLPPTKKIHRERINLTFRTLEKQ